LLRTVLVVDWSAVMVVLVLMVVLSAFVTTGVVPRSTEPHTQPPLQQQKQQQRWWWWWRRRRPAECACVLAHGRKRRVAALAAAWPVPVCTRRVRAHVRYAVCACATRLVGANCLVLDIGRPVRARGVCTCACSVAVCADVRERPCAHV
jgi:hypothetical protein